MSPGQPATPPASSPGRGRRRRYVAPPQNLGPGTDAIFTTPSTAAASPAREPDDTSPSETPTEPPSESPASRGATGGNVLPDRATEDTDAAWGEREGDGNDERLQSDRPPHWE